MSRKPGTRAAAEFILFDVFYEDGSQRSNRRVPAELLGGLEGDEPAKGYIIEQDREIAEKGGRPPLKIKAFMACRSAPPAGRRRYLVAPMCARRSAR